MKHVCVLARATPYCYHPAHHTLSAHRYKHVLFSPSLHNSYGATAFPAVSDALAVGDWRAAQRALDVVCHLLVRVAEALAGDVLAPTRAQRMMHESQPGSEL